MNSHAILAVAAIAAGASITGTALAADAPTPKVTAVAVQTAPSIGPNTIEVLFRTDSAIARKANGKSLDASVGLHSATEHSVGSLKAGSRCYVAYLHSSAKAGAQRTVHVLVQGSETDRKVTVARHATLGC